MVANKVKNGRTFSMSHQYVQQSLDSIVLEMWGGSADLDHVIVNRGGLIRTHEAKRVYIRNCPLIGTPNSNNKQDGCYYGLFWTKPVEDLLWDHTTLREYLTSIGRNPDEAVIQQGRAETAIRVKAVKCLFKGLEVRGATNGGHPIKQLVQFRHGQDIVVEDCTWYDSWPDVGQQKIAGQGYDTTQHIERITFRRNHFKKLTPAHDFLERHPGVKTLKYEDCTGPDGKTFSK